MLHLIMLSDKQIQSAPDHQLIAWSNALRVVDTSSLDKDSTEGLSWTEIRIDMEMECREEYREMLKEHQEETWAAQHRLAELEHRRYFPDTDPADDDPPF